MVQGQLRNCTERCHVRAAASTIKLAQRKSFPATFGKAPEIVPGTIW
jgi:hypothetical protein